MVKNTTILYQVLKNNYIPITESEYDALLKLAKIEAWKVVTQVIQNESSLFQDEEKFTMKEVVNAMKPTFNTKELDKYKSECDQLANRPLEEIKERRYT